MDIEATPNLQTVLGRGKDRTIPKTGSCSVEVALFVGFPYSLYRDKRFKNAAWLSYKRPANPCAICKSVKVETAFGDWIVAGYCASRAIRSKIDFIM